MDAMQQLAIFPVAATATLFAAWIAAGAATLSLLVTAVTAWLAQRQARRLDAISDRRFREFAGRDQWWTRFSWALERSTSPESQVSDLALKVLISLIGVPWASIEDNEMAYAAAALIDRPKGGETID
jgi:hypothetical protein